MLVIKLRYVINFDKETGRYFVWDTLNKEQVPFTLSSEHAITKREQTCLNNQDYDELKAVARNNREFLYGSNHA